MITTWTYKFIAVGVVIVLLKIDEALREKYPTYWKELIHDSFLIFSGVIAFIAIHFDILKSSIIIVGVSVVQMIAMALIKDYYPTSWKRSIHIFIYMFYGVIIITLMIVEEDWLR